MKQILVFIGGMVAGALLLYAIGFRTENSVREQIARELIEKLSDNLTKQTAKTQAPAATDPLPSHHQ
jgi:membrane protein DedA with SNARE-associated domain